ncbi:hypothetical protein KSC_101080 [Ktedonobacter sp. SOSP1-52]|nr:hypothetical protein KSC_101080 [Ktedonobacter sp. SOSP1-52]
MSTATMKVIQIHTYGGPEVLTYEEVSRPTAGPGEVLLRVAAAGVNPSDWKTRSGFADFPESRRPPRPSLPLILGHDASGIVEAVGPDVTTFQQGDAVYGQTRLGEALAGGTGTYVGAYAEYTTTRASNLAPKPATIDHLQAAAVPTAALTAWQALFEYGMLEAEQSVLINGAAGGVGHLAVQLAKARGPGSSGWHRDVTRRFCAKSASITSSTTRPRSWNMQPMRSIWSWIRWVPRRVIAC